MSQRKHARAMICLCSRTNKILIHGISFFLYISSAQNLILTEKQREMAICGGDKADGEKVALIREDETRTRVWQRGRGERTHSPSVKVEARAFLIFLLRRRRLRNLLVRSHA